MKNFDNIWTIDGTFGMSFFLEKTDFGYRRNWLNDSYGIDMRLDYWKRYEAKDTGFHKSEVEAYKLFCKL